MALLVHVCHSLGHPSLCGCSYRPTGTCSTGACLSRDLFPLREDCPCARPIVGEVRLRGAEPPRQSDTHRQSYSQDLAGPPGTVQGTSCTGWRKQVARPGSEGGSLGNEKERRGSDRYRKQQESFPGQQLGDRFLGRDPR